MPQKEYDERTKSQGGGMPEHTAPSGQVAAGTATEQDSRTGGANYEDRGPGASGDPEGKGLTATMTRQATEMAGQAKDQAKEMASEYGQKLQDSADIGKEKAAVGLESAAEQLRERVGEDGVQAQVGTKVADGLEKTATYLRDHDTSEIWSEIETFVKDHPMQAAAGALFAGFLMGRVLR